MVRSSLGRSVLLDSGGLAEEYPFCAISVPDFLEMTEWQPHQDLKASGKVREMGDKEEVLFCSHQWCSFTPSRPERRPAPGQLQTQIRNLMKGKTKTKSNFWLEAVYKFPWSPPAKNGPRACRTCIFGWIIVDPAAGRRRRHRAPTTAKGRETRPPAHGCC